MYIGSLLVETDINSKKKKEKNKIRLNDLLVSKFDMYKYVKQALAPAAKMLAPVYVGVKANQLIKVRLETSQKIMLINLDCLVVASV